MTYNKDLAERRAALSSIRVELEDLLAEVDKTIAALDRADDLLIARSEAISTVVRRWARQDGRATT